MVKYQRRSRYRSYQAYDRHTGGKTGDPAFNQPIPVPWNFDQAEPGLQVIKFPLQQAFKPGSPELFNTTVFKPEPTVFATKEYAATQQAKWWPAPVTADL